MVILVQEKYDEICVDSKRIYGVPCYHQDVTKDEARVDLRGSMTDGYYFGGVFKTVEMVGKEDGKPQTIFLASHEIGHRAFFPHNWFIHEFMISSVKANVFKGDVINIFADMVVNYQILNRLDTRKKFADTIPNYLDTLITSIKDQAPDRFNKPSGMAILSRVVLDYVYEVTKRVPKWCEEADRIWPVKHAVTIRERVKKILNLEGKVYYDEILALSKLVNKYISGREDNKIKIIIDVNEPQLTKKIIEDAKKFIRRCIDRKIPSEEIKMGLRGIAKSIGFPKDAIVKYLFKSKTGEKDKPDDSLIGLMKKLKELKAMKTKNMLINPRDTNFPKIDGIPDGIEIQHDGYSGILDIIRANGRLWTLKGTVDSKSYYGINYHVVFHSIFTEFVKTFKWKLRGLEKEVYYDSKVCNVILPPIEDEYQPRPITVITDPRYYDSYWVDNRIDWPKNWKILKGQEGLLWRGMSFDEMQFIINNGYIKSIGDYNIGETQVGKTYFSWEFSQSCSYAGGFAPIQFKPGFGKPSYVIGITPPDKEFLFDDKLVSFPEQAIIGKISFDRIVEICEVRTASETSGDFDLVPEFKTYKFGSSSGTNPRLIYRFLTAEERKSLFNMKNIKNKMINPEENINNIANYENGNYVSYHVTDNPEELIKFLDSRKSLIDGSTGDLGPGLYASTIPNFWMNRGNRKWNIYEKLPKEIREKIANEIRKEKFAIASFEYDFLERLLNMYVEYDSLGAITQVANLPFGFKFDEKFAEKIGLPRPEMPSVVKIVFNGRLLDMTDNPPYNPTPGYVGGYIRFGNQQLVLWDRNAIISYKKILMNPEKTLQYPKYSIKNDINKLVEINGKKKYSDKTNAPMRIQERFHNEFNLFIEKLRKRYPEYDFTSQKFYNQLDDKTEIWLLKQTLMG